MDNIKVKIRDVAYIDLLDSPVKQAVPEIQVDENGLITATSTQEKGSVVGGITRSEYQLAIQEGKTVAPSNETQLVMPKNRFSTGDIIVSPIDTQEKSLDLTDDGTFVVTPDDKYTLSKVNVKVDTSKKVESAYEAGKKAECEAFWDEFQDYGNITDCQSMFFGSRWTNAIYKPNHPLRPTNAYAMYQKTGITDIYCGGNTVVDFSQATDLYYTFSGTNIEHLGVLDFSSGTRMNSCFSGSAWLVSIDKLIISESMTGASGAFTNAIALTDVTIEGVIPVSIDIHWSPLFYGSIVSIISHLSDAATGQALTLSKAAVNKAFETTTSANDGSTSAEWQTWVTSKPNWTFSLI